LGIMFETGVQVIIQTLPEDFQLFTATICLRVGWLVFLFQVLT
jgi:hypothetical protein